jgi:hypothetical protein
MIDINVSMRLSNTDEENKDNLPMKVFSICHTGKLIIYFIISWNLENPTRFQIHIGMNTKIHMKGLHTTPYKLGSF